MSNPATRQKVDKSLKYRWGFAGVLLAGCLLVWYARNSGVLKQSSEVNESTLVKIVCPRCNNEEPRLKTCSLCGGRGFIWVDQSKYLPGEVTTIP
jgi:hypothetical protein